MLEVAELSSQAHKKCQSDLQHQIVFILFIYLLSHDFSSKSFHTLNL